VCVYVWCICVWCVCMVCGVYVCGICVYGVCMYGVCECMVLGGYLCMVCVCVWCVCVGYMCVWLPQRLYRDLFLPLCGVRVSVFKKASESLSVLSPAGGGGSAGHCRPGEGCVFD